MIDELTKFKIILWGETGVGCNQLCRVSTGQKFDDKAVAIVGYKCRRKLIEIKNKKYEIELYNVAGQERFRSISKNYLRDSDVVIFVYDITSYESLNALEEYRINEVKEILGVTFKGAIVGNKADLFLHMDKGTTKEDGYNLAKKFGFKFRLVSAKEDITSFNNLLIELIEDCLNDKDFLDLKYKTYKKKLK